MMQLPATSVDVKRVFSGGRLVLPHVQSKLSVQSTRALLCVGSCSLLKLVKDEDVLSAAQLADIKEDNEYLPLGWETMQ